MPSKPKRPCAYPNCANLTITRYCEFHAVNQQRHNTQSAYDANSRNRDSTAFYKSAAWVRCRRVILTRDNFLCQKCLQAGYIKPATTVHHKIHLDVDAELALDEDNLISVCAACHNKAHKRDASEPPFVRTPYTPPVPRGECT